jgi:hypothetical protein
MASFLSKSEPKPMRNRTNAQVMRVPLKLECHRCRFRAEWFARSAVVLTGSVFVTSDVCFGRTRSPQDCQPGATILGDPESVTHIQKSPHKERCHSESDSHVTSHFDDREEIDSGESFHPASRTMLSSFLQLLKQSCEIISIDEGIQID